MRTDMTFTGAKCCTCGNDKYMAVSQRAFRGFRWALLCTACGKRWRFANEHEKVVINARMEWVKANDK